MNKLRVLITAEVLANTFTGVEHYTVELVCALARREDVSVSVLCQKDEHAQVFPPNVVRRIHPAPARLGVLGYWLRRPACLGEYDVVHCPTVRTPFLQPPDGPKVVMTVHDLVPLVTPDYHRLSYRVYYRHVLPRIARSCDALVADSESTKRDLLREFSDSLPPITVVPCGPRWGHADVGADAPERENFFFTVGTLEPRKNLKRVVEAFLSLKLRFPESPERLVIAGKVGWGVGELQSLFAANSDTIDVLGYVSEEELQALYRRAKALVYPSLYEGFGLPILEAMSLGCPVITSDRSSLPEVAGDAALYVDAEDVEDIALAMRRISTDECLAADLSERGLERAELFSWDRCAAETMYVYRSLMANSPAPVPAAIG